MTKEGDGTGKAPRSPSDLHREAWWLALRRAARGFLTDACPDAAAALTFYSVLALFPGLVAALSLLGVVGQDDEAAQLVLAVLGDVAPRAEEAVREPILEIAASDSAPWVLAAGLAIALWSASRYVGAFSRTMNGIWGREEGRPVVSLKLHQLGVTLICSLLAALGLAGAAISTPVARAIGDIVGAGDTGVLVWRIARWPFLLAIVVVIVAILYHTGPNARRPRFRWVSIGALFAIVVLAAASAGFAVYASDLADYERLYGSFAGVVVGLLWMWIANMALLFGAEVDAELERARELQAGLPAEEDIQLPMRDARRILRKARTEREEKRLSGEVRRNAR
ncbi:YihY/virulence factor BrkB family protein [Microbacterium gilvum]|uniref:YihY/virulence factor BrkB family protein n=1 Tax=Microbacterium gilvum TaxID=1336204 RepID=A0ABP8ZTS4_9MICO